jgi:hypothetical protein
MFSRHPCWHCRYFGGWRIGYFTLPPRKPHATAACGREDGRHAATKPEIGCVHFEREPGADDEPGCIDPCGKRYEP